MWERQGNGICIGGSNIYFGEEIKNEELVKTHSPHSGKRGQKEIDTSSVGLSALNGGRHGQSIPGRLVQCSGDFFKLNIATLPYS